MDAQFLKVDKNTPVSVLRERARLNGAETALVLPSDAQKAVFNMVNAITTLALLNATLLHINIIYSPECAGLAVKVYKADTNYFGLPLPIFNRATYLDVPSSLMQLKTLEDDLIELVADAKDKIMGAV